MVRFPVDDTLDGLAHFRREIGSHLGPPQQIGCLTPNAGAQRAGLRTADYITRFPLWLFAFLCYHYG